MADNAFTDSVKELLSGLDGFVTSKTVIGDPITVKDATIIPFMEVSLGVGAGVYDKKGRGTGGALGAKMIPTAVLILQNGGTKLISIKDQDTVLRVLDMVPEVIDRIKGLRVSDDPDIEEKVHEVFAEKEEEQP